MKLGIRFALFALVALATAATAATPSVTAGAEHALALKADGTLRAWGNDTSGQLGVGRLLQSSIPRLVPGLPRLTAMSAGFGHVLGLASDGTVWSWGFNSSSQLGDGSATNRSTPQRIAGLSNVVAVAAGDHYSLAVRSDGILWAWGANDAGQLGDGTHTTRAVPVQVPGIPAIVAVSAGLSHTVALASDGTVWAWGQNDSGELGDGSLISRATPARVPGLTEVAAISAGKNVVGEHTLVLKRDGTVWAWGSNYAGRLGDGTTTDRSIPVQVTGLTGVIAISAGDFASHALKGDGTVWSWGSNISGELGIGSLAEQSLFPVQAMGLTEVVAISAGGISNVVALKRDGTAWGWGYNAKGQVGDGTTILRRTPVQVVGLGAMIAISAGGTFTVALASDGSLRAWGDNFAGQLGESSSARTTPGSVASLTGVVAVAAGAAHTIALKSDGTVWSWGDNFVGQLVGQLFAPNQSTAAQVPGLSNIVAISAGTGHSLALRADGVVLGWGAAGSCGFALGTTVTSSPSPVVTIPGLPAIAAIASGSFHNLALTPSGDVWTWGCNGSGQLGDATTSSRAAPSRVAGLPRIVAVAAGDDHSLALASDGSLWAWGRNASGQLGDGSAVDRAVPVRVALASGASVIAGGSAHSLAIAMDGSVWTWGDNSDGQLGDGTRFASAVPIRASNPANAIAVAASRETVSGRTASSSFAVARDGSVWSWGSNTFGQIGDGTFAARVRPVVVLREDGTGSLTSNDWFLDLDPGIASAIPADSIPIFRVLASGSSTNVSATFEVRPQDVGSITNIYVFALAPASIVKGTVAEKDRRFGALEKGAKDTSLQCVLAQLTASGQLQAVSTANIQAYVSGVVAGQQQAVSVVNGVEAATIGGATFFLGYGSNPTSMVGNGTNRSVASIPGSVNCQPAPPQKGWWWNPVEGGRGYSIEVNGNHFFYAAYLYDASGRATWLISTGSTSLEGSVLTSDLLGFSGGQALGGPFPGFPPSHSEGSITLAFNDASHGTMVWPGGTVPIERFNIVPNGLTLPKQANEPEGGWWWNPEEPGRGFFMEWQGGELFMAGYMYEPGGAPIWYLSSNTTPTTNPQIYSNTWWQYANGQTLTGPFKPASQINNNVAPVTITFQGAENAIMTLPNNRTTALRRFRF